MGIKETPYITFGAQTGGLAAGQVVSQHWAEPKKLLRKYCDYRYAPQLAEFAPVLRVDGNISHWDTEGVEKLRLMRKQRYITIDIMMPRSRWEGISAMEIRRYLLDNMKVALKMIIAKLKKEHIEVDEKRLFDDFANVEKEYLGTSNNMLV